MKIKNNGIEYGWHVNDDPLKETCKYLFNESMPKYNYYSISSHMFKLTASTTISPLRTETRLRTRSL